MTKQRRLMSYALTVTLGSLVAVSSSFAEGPDAVCARKVAQFEGTRIVYISRNLELTGRSGLSDLSEIEKRALRHYLKFHKINLSKNQPVTINTTKHFSDKKWIGKKVALNYREEETTISYFFTLNEELLYWSLDSRNPEEKWICE